MTPSQQQGLRIGQLAADDTAEVDGIIARAGVTDEPAERGFCAGVARRAPGGPSEAEPGADAGPAAPRSGAA